MTEEETKKSWHLDIGFHIIEKLTSKPQPKKYRKYKLSKLPMMKAKSSKIKNPLIKKETIISVKRNPTHDISMRMLRNSILPVTQDFEKVLKWLNTVTT
jgi:hypothetical protein